MRKLLLLMAAAAALLSAQNLLPSEQPVTNQALWRGSVTALAVANTLDIHSSWGKHELNSTLAGPAGTFGKQGALLKLGFQGGLIGLEYLITRGHPTGKVYRALSFINFGAAGVIAATAAHNYTVARPLR